MNDQQSDFQKFYNPTLGELEFDDVVNEVVAFMSELPGNRYKVMIGSDSNGFETLDLVSVVAVHRVGRGGRYFWHRRMEGGIHTLRQKIYAEVAASLKLASIFVPKFRKELQALAGEKKFPFKFEIHVDVGERGQTRDLIKEVTGFVRGYGYEVLIKPEAAAATTFADRHVRL